MFKILLRHGLCKNIPLNHIAACIPEEFHGVHILHALCNGLYIQFSGHVNDIGHNNTLPPDIPALVEKQDVQLQHVDRQVLQQVKGTVAGTEIIQGTDKTLGLKLPHNVGEQIRII